MVISVANWESVMQFTKPFSPHPKTPAVGYAEVSTMATVIPDELTMNCGPGFW